MKLASSLLPSSARDRKTGNGRPLLASIAILLLGASGGTSLAQTTGFNQSAGGTYDYNDPANWVGGVINGLWDASLTVLGDQTATFAADTALGTGLTFNYNFDTTGRNVTLRGTGAARTITLGGDITVNTVSTTRTITVGSTTANQGLNVDLGGAVRTFTVGTGRTLSVVNTISNGGLVVSGGTIALAGVNTYSGTTTVNSGNLTFNGATASAINSDITVKAGNGTPVVTFNSNSGSGTVRAKTVTLNGVSSSNGAFISVTGNAGANSVDSIANALITPAGVATISVTANGSRNARLEAGSFVRSAGSSVLFRGSDLGVSAIADAVAGDANILFTTAPALAGAGGTGTTLSILKGAFGEITTGGSGSGGGLVTHDATHGVRLLNFATEYTATIGNGQTQLDNVRFARASGDASQDVNLTSALTTINSLSFKITGASGSGSGVAITGDPGTTLKLHSGTIFASQVLTGTASPNTYVVGDAMTVSVPTLDLNGQEGVITVFTNGINNGNTSAPLHINSVIANDGGNGVTIGGGGQVIFGGSEANTYTGTTTLNSGILRLNKSVANIGLTTDLVMNGGTLLKGGNAIADTASVTIHGGTFWMDNTTSSGNNGHSETINHFTITGGSFGNHGSNAALTINGNATISGSQLGMNQGGDITVLGTTTLNGGRLIAREASSTTAANALTTLNQLTIINAAAGAYTAATLDGHATNKGALVTLNGNVTFTGNSTNANPVTIASTDPTLANQGVIALNGARTFAIGNGAATVDLEIVPALTDNGVTAGGLVKTGPGTLALKGANTYTGATEVADGTLVVNGTLTASAITVYDGGTLAGDGTVGALTLAGTLSPGRSPGVLNAGSTLLQDGGRLTLELRKDSSGLPGVDWDQLNITGVLDVSTLSFGGFTLELASFAGDNTIFDPNTDRLWSAFIKTTGGIEGFLAEFFTLETDGFSTALNGTFSIEQNGNALDLRYDAVPEPASALILLTGVGLLAARRGNRGRQVAQRH
jgi:autotransporter-associated beta strand protein